MTSPQIRFARYAWAVLAFNLAVVSWGAYVRATGAGAGCGNHWPLCNGMVVPRSPEWKTVIEFTHRLSSGAALLLVLGLLIWARRVFPARHPARLGAALSVTFIVTEALLGAGLVLFEHVAQNASTMRAWSLSAHLINTMTLLACLALTGWWASGKAAIAVRGTSAWTGVGSLAVVLVLGVSGALAALGDTLFPSTSLAAGLARDFAPSAHLFERLRILHPFLAAGGGAWLLFYTVTTATASRDELTRQLAWAGAWLLMIQLLSGVVNVLLLAPVWMQLVHLLQADLLWIALVLLAARRLARE